MEPRLRPALPDLFPVSFPGVKTSRNGFLVDVDLARLRALFADYFDASVIREDIARRYPGVHVEWYVAPAEVDELLHEGPVTVCDGRRNEAHHHDRRGTDRRRAKVEDRRDARRAPRTGTF